MQEFLKGNSGDFEKFISGLITKSTPIEVVTRYTKCFHHLENNEKTEDFHSKIQQFITFFTQLIPFLDNLINMSEKIFAAQRKQN